VATAAEDRLSIRQQQHLRRLGGQRLWPPHSKLTGRRILRQVPGPMLTTILRKVPGVLEGSHGSRWPVGRLVTILNAEFSPPPWSDDRVENAKKRLLNWVQRLMRQNGLDATDLEAVFARVARQQVQLQMPAMDSGEANLQS